MCNRVLKMPKQAINYQNTIIYKIVCKDLNIKDLYIGHTTNFKERKRCHKKRCNYHCKKYSNLYVYKFIRDNGGWDNWDMIEVEKYSCLNVYEALKRERYWYEELQGNLNIQIPSRTPEEYSKKYKEEHKEEIKQKNKEYIRKYREEYKEQIAEKRNEKIECDCGSIVCKGDLSRHKKTKKHKNFESGKINFVNINKIT